MVVKSSTEENSIVVITEMKAVNDIVITEIHLEKSGGRSRIINSIASIYGWKNFENWLKNQEILYSREEKSLILDDQSPLQSLGDDQNKAYAKNILKPEDIVKPYSRKFSRVYTACIR